jgi:hypothetical protein
MSQRVAGSQHRRDNHTGTCTDTTTAFKPGPSKKPGEGSKPRAFSPTLKRRKSKPKPRTNGAKDRKLGTPNHHYNTRTERNCIYTLQSIGGGRFSFCAACMGLCRFIIESSCEKQLDAAAASFHFNTSSVTSSLAIIHESHHPIPPILSSTRKSTTHTSSTP